MDQLHRRSCFTPMSVKYFTSSERKKYQIDLIFLTKKLGRKHLHIVQVMSTQGQGSSCACGGLMGLVSSSFPVRRDIKENKTGKYGLTYSY